MDSQRTPEDSLPIGRRQMKLLLGVLIFNHNERNFIDVI